MSRAICIIDTSVFCEILAVPNMDDIHKEILAELEAKMYDRETLLLPMTTILETGNHIGQNGDGEQRRQTAIRFTEQVGMALRGESPFTPTPLQDQTALNEWLNDFPAWVKRTDLKGKGSGFGDLTIYKIWEEQCAKHKALRVYIWSLDEQLCAYDRLPEL